MDIVEQIPTNKIMSKKATINKPMNIVDVTYCTPIHSLPFIQLIVFVKCHMTTDHRRKVEKGEGGDEVMVEHGISISSHQRLPVHS
jgi:hypothetical protein